MLNKLEVNIPWFKIAFIRERPIQRCFTVELWFPMTTGFLQLPSDSKKLVMEFNVVLWDMEYKCSIFRKLKVKKTPRPVPLAVKG